MVSQAQGFVHLLAAAVDGSHEPQVFRMRWDQPLKRFARAYAVFRELGPHAEVGLAMSTRSHGELDPNSPPGVYGLTDGDQVLFTPGPAKMEAKDAGQAEGGEAAVAAEAPAAAAAEEKADADVPSVQSPEAPDPARGASAEVSSALVGSASPWEASAGFPPVAAALPAKATPAKAAAKAQGQKRAAAATGRGRVGGAPCEASASAALVAVEAKPKAKAKAKGKAKAKAKAQAQAQPKAKAKAKAKGKAKGKGKGKGAKDKGDKAAAAAAASRALVAAAKPVIGALAKSVAPPVPRNLMRSATAASGPAKGWKVTAWLQAPKFRKQDITGRQGRTHDSMVRWRIISPDRTRTFSTFSKVQKDEGDGVYAQLYTAVRPDLLRRINCRRQILEGITPPKRRKLAPEAVEEGGQATPARPIARPLRGALRAAAQAPAEMLATQLFAPAPQQQASPKSAAWTCDCDAHLRRHSRCAFGGNLQPSVVHLRDYMLIGRGETCDVVLNSRRTPQMISRCHAVLHREEGRFALVDQGSLNGLLINGEPVRGRRTLEPGDVVTFGVPSPQPEFDYIFEERQARKDEAAGDRGALAWDQDLSMAPTAAA